MIPNQTGGVLGARDYQSLQTPTKIGKGLSILGHLVLILNYDKIRISSKNRFNKICLTHMSEEAAMVSLIMAHPYAFHPSHHPSKTERQRC